MMDGVDVRTIPYAQVGRDTFKGLGIKEKGGSSSFQITQDFFSKIDEIDAEKLS